METNNKMLEPLKHIQRVKPSENLFSKIESKIAANNYNIVTAKQLMAISIVLIILIGSNSFFINKNLKSNNSTLVETFNINISNQLYYE